MKIDVALFPGFLFTILYTLGSIASGAETGLQGQSSLKFKISFSEEAHSQPITGRVYVMISRDSEREPRLQIGPTGVPFWGKDVISLEPGESVIIDGSVLGYPLRSIQGIPPDVYFIQAFVNIYTEFKRSDGHTLWMHNDQWEGQKWRISPGNIYSKVMEAELDPSDDTTIELKCDEVIPPVEVPEDTKWVKRVKFQSEMLTEFWGEPVYLGATILLPKGYDEHPGVHYPVNYIQGHFSLRPPYGFTTEEPDEGDRRGRRGYTFYQHWISDECPRMIAVTFQHPCPYYDDSYAVNSPNCGPYGDAILEELIPYVEERFRIISEPYARVLSGGSTGGWVSLALQMFHPDFFGGTFSSCPDPIDFRYFQCVNIYEDKNAFYKEFGWRTVPTASDRTPDGIVTLTFEQRNHYELVAGTRGRSGDQIDIFEAAFGPIGKDGYFQPLFDQSTGEIDPSVAEYWKEHSDLRHYIETNWPTIGPKLEGKLHIYTGDMDTHYLNPAVELMEEFLEETENPYYDGVIEYGDGEPHCWGPRGKDLIQLMADHIKENAPLDWEY